MANQSRDWRRGGQMRDDDFRNQGRNQRWGSGSEWDEDRQGGSRADDYGSDYGGRAFGGERNEEDDYRGASERGRYESRSDLPEWQRDQSRFGSGSGGRMGREYSNRGFSSESRGQSWGDRNRSQGGSQGSGEREYGGEYSGSPSGYFGSSRDSSGGSGSYGRYGSGAGHGGGDDARGQQQNFRGRGPKGYQRSDERIKEAICEQLSDDPRIDASEISVAVSNGTVTLTGSVNDRGTKYEVEELVCDCGGVKEVENRLKVQSQSQSGQSGQSQSGQSGARSEGGSGRSSSSH